MNTRDAWVTPSLADRGSVVLRTLGSVSSASTEALQSNRAPTNGGNDTIDSGSVTGGT
jgi:hypothetical protein